MQRLRRLFVEWWKEFKHNVQGDQVVEEIEMLYNPSKQKIGDATFNHEVASARKTVPDLFIDDVLSGKPNPMILEWSDISSWSIVSDGMFGGGSAAQLVPQADTFCEFKGTLSLNPVMKSPKMKPGFAGFYAPVLNPPLSVRRGDRFALIVRSNVEQLQKFAIIFRCYTVPEGEPLLHYRKVFWVHPKCSCSIEILFEDLEELRGGSPNGVFGAFDPTDVLSVGFQALRATDKNETDFSLLIERLSLIQGHDYPEKNFRTPSRNVLPGWSIFLFPKYLLSFPLPDPF
jgi:hypothetical protein